MDLRSYIELKEAYAKMHTSEEVISEEILSEEDLVENPNAGAGHKNTDTKKDWANNPNAGFLGKIERQRRKAFGTDREKRQANSYEASVNAISKRQKTTPGQAKITANDVAAETAGRRKADPNYKPGQNQASNKNVAQVGPNAKDKAPKTQPAKTQPAKTQPPKTQPKTQPPSTQPPSTQPPRTQPAKTTPAPTPKVKQTGDKAKDMATWAKANPTLANKKKTANPLMKSFNKPAPKPAPATATGGAAKPNPAAATGSSRLAKALSGIKPMKKLGEEYTQFDLILEYLVDSGFPEEEALVVMVNMSGDKQLEILESYLTEEDADKLRDARQVRGGVDGNTNYKRAPRKAEGSKKSPEERKKASQSAYDFVMADLKKKYGDKAIIGNKKKD